MRSCSERANILAFFVPLRLSSVSMAEAPVAILPYVLEAVRPAAIPPSSYLLQRGSLSDWISWRVSFSISFSQRVSLRLVSQRTSLSAVMACVAFTLVFLDVCRLPVSHFWGESLSLVSWCLSYFALHFVFIACVAYKFFFSWRVAFRLFLRRVSPSSQPFLACVAYKLFSWRGSPSSQPFLACVAFTLVSWCLSYFALHLVFIARVAYNLFSLHVPPSSCFHGVCRLKVSGISRLVCITCFAHIFIFYFRRGCRSQVSSAFIARIPFRLVCLQYFLLLILN